MPISLKKAAKQGQSWTKWLERYGIERFYRSFIRNAQNAESVCVHCRQPIYLDIAEGGGVPDWCTAGGDYGCSSRTGDNDSHMPRKLPPRSRG